MSWQWRMMQNLKRNWLVISKLTWGIWWILTRALESLKNFHFNALLLSKVYIVWAKKKYRGVEESTFCFKIGIGNLTNFDLSTGKSQKKFTLTGSFWAKYILLELKRYRGVIFHGTEEGYKIWRGIDLSFQSWHKEFDKFWPEHLKSQKCSLWWASFEQSICWLS